MVKCSHCQQWIDEPTFKQTIRDLWYCPECGAKETVTQDQRNEQLIDLEQRISDLERDLSCFQTKG